jgi:hypothetical protein
MMTSGVTQTRETNSMFTTVTFSASSVKATTTTTNHSRTVFRMAPSPLGPPNVLAQMAGDLHGPTLHVTQWRTKMAEVDPTLVTDADSEMVSAELIMLYHVLDVLPAVDRVTMTIDQSFGAAEGESKAVAFPLHSLLGFQPGDITIAATKQDISARYHGLLCNQITVEPWSPEGADSMHALQKLKRELKKLAEHCEGGRLRKITCKGRLAGEESIKPYEELSQVGWAIFVQELFTFSQLVEVPSMNVRYVPAIKKPKHVLHIQEIVFEDALNEPQPVLRILELMREQFVSVDRWVFRIAVRRQNIELVNSIAGLNLGADVYLVLDPVNEKTLNAAQSMHVDNFIVDRNFETNPPAILSQFLSRAKAVVYRRMRGTRKKNPLKSEG